MLGFPFPHLSAHELQVTLRGIERLAQHNPQCAPPITPQLLSILVSCGVDFDPSDVTFSCAFLFAFFLFARISNLVPESLVASSVHDYKRIYCGDIVPTHYGLCVKFTWSKTIQLGQRVLELPLVQVPNSSLCPVRMFYLCVSLFPLLIPSPFLSSPLVLVGCDQYLRVSLFLFCVTGCSPAGVPQSHLFRGHSFRRGGTSWAFSSSIPGELIQVFGDWRSDAYKCYLDVSMPLKLRVSQGMVARLAQSET